MTSLLEVDDGVVFNNSTVSGSPGYRIVAKSVRLTNSESGRIIAANAGDAAILLVGGGSTIINEAGGIIRNASGNVYGSDRAIIGSAGDDRIENAGTLSGVVAFGGGNDVYVDRAFGAYGEPLIEGGDGDDTYILFPTKAYARSARFDGGDGIDTLIIDGADGNVSSFVLSSVENVVIRVNSTVESIVGVQGIVFDMRSEGVLLSGLRLSDSPDADVKVLQDDLGRQTNVSIYDRSAIGAFFGSSASDSVRMGNDTIIARTVDLGAGNDFLTISRSQFSNPELVSLGSAIKGGSGYDTLSIQQGNTGNFDAGNVSEFEVLYVDWPYSSPPYYDVSTTTETIIRNASGFAEVSIADYARVRFEAAQLADAAFKIVGPARLSIDAASTLGSVTVQTFGRDDTTLADDTLSVTIVTQGLINGLINFSVGDDVLDGTASLGTLTANGGVGNDNLSGGVYADHLDGGSGGDTIDGGDGDDVLNGDGGADSINGGNGNDVIAGGAGKDVLYGGSGSDRFVFSGITESPSGLFDQVEDFETGIDKIVLSGFVVSNLTIAPQFGGGFLLSGMGSSGEIGVFVRAPIVLSDVVRDANATIAANTADQSEGNSGSKAFTFTVTRGDSSTGTSIANWAVTGSGANAADATDFAGGVLPSGAVSFAAGETSKVITINVNGDSAVEPDDEFTVMLASASAGTLLTTASAGGIIRNDDAAVNQSRDLTGDGSAFRNETDTEGEPAFRLLGNNIGFTNTASIIGTDTRTAFPSAYAIEMVGVGNTIINTVSGTLGAAGSPTVRGSSGDDRIENAGLLAGNIDLGEGSDTILDTSGRLTNAEIRLGPGDDRFIISQRNDVGNSIGGFAGVLRGDEGYDTVVLDRVAAKRWYWFASAFERLEFIGDDSGSSTLLSISEDDIISLDVQGFRLNLTESALPGVSATISGGWLILGGEDQGNRATVLGSVTGGSGRDILEVGWGRIASRVDLGGGDDDFRLSDARADVSEVSGGDGNDTFGLIRLNTGIQIYDGGEGIDMLSFSRYDESVNVSLMFSGSGSVGNTVIHSNFEDLQGTAFNDTLEGSDVANRLDGLDGNDEIFGLAGDDTLSGWAGDDILEGGNGDDRINGGDGNDIATYADSASNYTVTQLTNGSVTVVDKRSSGGTGNDTLTGIETLRFAGVPVRLADAGSIFSISAATADQPEGNGGSKTFTFTIIRTGNTSGAASVTWAVTGSGGAAAAASGADFVGAALPGGTIDFVSGETSKVITINVNGDTNFEPDEGFTMTLQAPSVGAVLATTAATGWIRNDDGAPFLGSSGNDTFAGTPFNDTIFGQGGDDILSGMAGNDLIDGGGGLDFAVFSQTLAQSTITRQSATSLTVNGPDGNDRLVGIELLQFADGVVQLDDGLPLTDDLFYAQRYADVLRAGVDPDVHYANFGWREGRDPNALFSTVGYLGANPDVREAGINPLVHYSLFGWQEGRDPSAQFDTRMYLVRNPDVAAARIDPFQHFLEYGQFEGRNASPAIGAAIGADGFDRQYYLMTNADVAAAGIDPYQHFRDYGWREGRNPNAWFDTAAYLNTYRDVAAAGINPLDHYHLYGWREGRDPSVRFDTSDYLNAYRDVAAAGIDPLVHYLQSGAYELRNGSADGVLG